MEKEENVEREDPFDRNHDLYFESEHWTVVDFSGVDHLFVAGLPSFLEVEKSTGKTGPNPGENEVRIDMDGFMEPSSEVGDEGDNVNISAWLPLDKAKELRDELEKAIEENFSESA